jgi:hypothetical protein
MSGKDKGSGVFSTVGPLMATDDPALASNAPLCSELWAIRSPAGCSKCPDFSPTQPWRLLHPPAQSLPRQPLRPGTRLFLNKAAASEMR